MLLVLERSHTRLFDRIRLRDVVTLGQNIVLLLRGDGSRLLQGVRLGHGLRCGTQGPLFDGAAIVRHGESLRRLTQCGSEGDAATKRDPTPSTHKPDILVSQTASGRPSQGERRGVPPSAPTSRKKGPNLPKTGDRPSVPQRLALYLGIGSLGGSSTCHVF